MVHCNVTRGPQTRIMSELNLSMRVRSVYYRSAQCDWLQQYSALLCFSSILSSCGALMQTRDPCIVSPTPNQVAKVQLHISCLLRVAYIVVNEERV